ncbi:TetR/AcrR family transcriptional regulator [Enterococcus sp. HY326]|uniref:TetR/AcrR family transcriptional regulator n=1 Tax=Enterococcus sp. HY326 TaxID=2971265 RepID=UPI00223E985A|nr:TetR/AcrR family transcriptional regulator [Enterococcus sp. HY326]
MNNTEKKILSVSRNLFAEKDASQVTVREIAEKSGISHTTIYLYFKSKEEIIRAIALEPLENLFEELLEITKSNQEPAEKLFSLCNHYIAFGFEQKNIYKLVSLYEGERVDLPSYSALLSKNRMKSLELLREAIIEWLPADLAEEKKINIVRGVFFFLHGIIMTYENEEQQDLKRIQTIVRDYLDYTILSNHHEEKNY